MRPHIFDFPSFPEPLSDLLLVEVSTTFSIDENDIRESSDFNTTWYEARIIGIEFPSSPYENNTTLTPLIVQAVEIEQSITPNDDGVYRSNNPPDPSGKHMCTDGHALPSLDLPVRLSQAIAVAVQLPDGSPSYKVPLRCVRLPPPSAVDELFVPRPNVLTEIRFDGEHPCWTLGYVKRILEEERQIEVVLSENPSLCECEMDKETRIVSRESLRRADLGRTLADIGGIVKEIIYWPVEAKGFLMEEGSTGETRLQALRKKANLFKVR